MPVKIPDNLTPPPVGTLIDGDKLELVEVLGVGGYGVVYRAVDVHSLHSTSYAVKCLMHTQSNQNSRQRQLHIREIMLHQLASAHPNVVSLHRVVEEPNYTYLIMEYAYDGDLFSQILHNSRYLGDDYSIKHVFLQIIDAVEHCHSLGIYHRDLKPENVLCFDGGFRVAITDFGLATTEKLSEEFRTGSIYHMSPECQGGRFASSGTYSPLANDIWSLGIILLNLATGRNPWKSASMSDPTFLAYLHSPDEFLPTVLPISQEANAILIQMLAVNWRRRISLPDLRQAIENVQTFYSDGAVFEGSMARCPWEAGLEIESGSEYSSTKAHSAEVPEKPGEIKSFWSQDSDIVFAAPSAEFLSPSTVTHQTSWMDFSSCNATWGLESLASSSLGSQQSGGRRSPKDTRTTRSSHSPTSTSGSESSPSTPTSMDLSFALGAAFDDPKQRLIETDMSQIPYLNGSITSLSRTSSMMHTAVENFHPYSSYFLASAMSSKPSHPSSPFANSISTDADREMEEISWTYPASPKSPSIRSMDSTTDFGVSGNPGDDGMQPQPRLDSTRVPIAMSSILLDVTRNSSSSSPPAMTQKKPQETKKLGLFMNLRFPFPRTPPASLPEAAPTPLRQTYPSTDSLASRKTPLQPASAPTSPLTRPGTNLTSSTLEGPIRDGNCHRHARIRSARHWFSAAKLFAVS